MTSFGQSPLLQALGWAIFNSIWQAGLLWFAGLLVRKFFRLDSYITSRLSGLLILGSFFWFAITFTSFYNSGSDLAAFTGLVNAVSVDNFYLKAILFAASASYCVVLIVPVFRFIRSYRFLGQIQQQGLRKPDYTIRLFVDKVSKQLAIKSNITVYVSDIVRSPLTVGFIKPVILLPVSVITSLSSTQIEAILLHELSHIKRRDYLLNLLVSVITTLLYFNPFIKLLASSLDEEREHACDELVLQFGYDRVSYASALLTLQKEVNTKLSLMVCATGNTPMLRRIEKIIGIQKKVELKKYYYGLITVVLIAAIFLNSISSLRIQGAPGLNLLQDRLSGPFTFLESDETDRSVVNNPTPSSKATATITVANYPVQYSWNSLQPSLQSSPTYSEPFASNSSLSPLNFVAATDMETHLDQSQIEEINATVDASKTVLANLQWKQAESEIAEVLTEQEKTKAKETYMKVLDQVVNWQNLKDNLKAGYENVDWNTVNAGLEKKLSEIKLDSLRKVCNTVVVQLQKLELQKAKASKPSCSLIPDVSLNEVKKSVEHIQLTIDTIQAIRNPKPIIRL